MSALEYAKILLAKKSITPDDAGCQEWLKEKFAALGFTCKTYQINNVTNLWAYKNKPKLCFVGHTDVVPAGDDKLWHSPPFTPTIAGEYLVARGAQDMKSSIACWLAACEDIAKNNGAEALDGIAVLITSDEEGPSIDGIKEVVKILQQNNELPEYALVGEPSCEKTLGDTIKIGRRGSLHGKLRVIGEQGHIAYPDKSRNPIFDASSAINALQEITWDEGNDLFNPTQFQISNIHSGYGADNVIPGEAIIDFNFRYCPESSVELLKQQVISCLDNLGLNYTIDWRESGRPFYTEKNNKLITKLQQSIQKQTALTPVLSTSGGTSDGRFLAPLGVKVVEFGPVNNTIHRVNEKIKVQDLQVLVAIYRDLICPSL